MTLKWGVGFLGVWACPKNSISKNQMSIRYRDGDGVDTVITEAEMGVTWSQVPECQAEVLPEGLCSHLKFILAILNLNISSPKLGMNFCRC